jgi:hypothetical protein
MVLTTSQLVDPIVGIWDVITTLCTTFALNWTLMNSTLAKFEELVTLMLPIIINHVKLTKEVCRFYGQPCKLTLEQCLLNFILYFKHDNVTIHGTFMWNWSKNLFAIMCYSFCHALMRLCKSDLMVDYQGKGYLGKGDLKFLEFHRMHW